MVRIVDLSNYLCNVILVQIRLYLIGIIGLRKRGCFVAKRLLATTEMGSCVTVCHCERSEAISHFEWGREENKKLRAGLSIERININTDAIDLTNVSPG
jgi:hypothetical protein